MKENLEITNRNAASKKYWGNGEHKEPTTRAWMRGLGDGKVERVNKGTMMPGYEK